MSYGQVAQAEEVEYRIESALQKKVKKPGFFKRWLFNSLKEVAQVESDSAKYENKVRGLSTTISARQSQVDLDRDRAIQFNVYIANGGRVVETRRYDRKSDRHNTGLYIISDSQDFGREIDKIIVMEGLK